MYIVFEGIVGTGKSTQSRRYVEWLKKRYPAREIVWIREPGGTKIAERIRDVVQGAKAEGENVFRRLVDLIDDSKMVGTEVRERVCATYLFAALGAQNNSCYCASGETSETEMNVGCEVFLYAASRAQSLRQVVLPCLVRGGVVVSDRSFVTSLAYQGYASGLGIQRVLVINNRALQETIPDAVVFLDLDVNTALSRTNDARGDKWELRGTEFFEKVREGYLEVSRLPMFSGRWLAVSGEGSEDEVFSRIISALDLRI